MSRPSVALAARLGSGLSRTSRRNATVSSRVAKTAVTVQNCQRCLHVVKSQPVAGPSRTIQCRFNGSASFARPTAMDRAMSTEKRKPASFEALGIPTPIVARLKAAFPHIRGPTPAQSEFIPAVLANKDVFLKDGTGRGKTLAIALAALALATNRRYAGGAPNVLVMVPSIYLMSQLHQWMLALQDPEAPSKVHCLGPHDADLPEKLPTILLTTPTALFALQTPPPLAAVHHVILDEPDTQIKPIPSRHFSARNLPQHPINVHPPPATRILDHLLGIVRSPDGKGDFSGRLDDVQTVWCSASLNAPFRTFVHTRGWHRVDKSQVVNLDYSLKPGIEGGAAEVQHYCIIVDPVTGVLSDLKEYASPPASTLPISKPIKGLTFPPVLLEALAMLHVSAPTPPGKTSLVLAPEGTSLAKLGDELSGLGLSSQILDTASEKHPEQTALPDLYLLPRSQAAGLHLDNLHTVYLLSGLDQKSLTPRQQKLGGTTARIRAYDGYQGRVGRLGTDLGGGEPQRVVTIVESGGSEEHLMQKVFFTEHSADREVSLSEWQWGGLGV